MSRLSSAKNMKIKNDINEKKIFIENKEENNFKYFPISLL